MAPLAHQGGTELRTRERFIGSGFVVGASMNKISKKESPVSIAAQVHPLDPLSADEFRALAALLASALMRLSLPRSWANMSPR